jgi:hypothetical protein
MFISKAEKEDLFYRIMVLEQTALTLRAAFAQTGMFKPRKGREWSPEQRAIASANMKARHAKEKAQKEKV